MSRDGVRRIATVGTFDGVHRGHAAVLDTLREEGLRRGLQAVAITFARHPLKLIAPERAPLMLTLPKDRDRLIREHGVLVYEAHLTRYVAEFSAERWMQAMHSVHGVEALVLGHDNTFGHDGRSLTREQYHEIGRRVGVEVIDAPKVEGVSSSAVRRAVAEGRVEDAAAMLGRPFGMYGKVVHGSETGRTIGFPTANLQTLEGMAVPGGGVYAARVHILPQGSGNSDGSEETQQTQPIAAMVNIGTRPTVGPGLPQTVEAHLLDWSGDLYGRVLRLDFVARLRDERRFGSLDELRRQLEADRESARQVLV